MKTIYTIPAPDSQNATIEVYGDPDNAWYEWRIIDGGRIVQDTSSEGRQYGQAEIALRDALMVASGLKDGYTIEAGNRQLAAEAASLEEGYAAKARGVKFGPRPTLTPAQIEHARELIEGGRTVKEAASLLGVHRSTLYRALARGEEVTRAEARRRGAFAEDALSEADALAAVDGERQEEGPAFLDDEDPADALPPPPYRTQSLPQILAALTDDELARWPGEMADQEQERRIAAK